MMFRAMLKGWWLSFCLICLAAAVHFLVPLIISLLKVGWSTSVKDIFGSDMTQFMTIIVESLLAICLIGLTIFIIGGPIYAIIYYLAFVFSKWSTSRFSLRFEVFFLISYLVFGLPFLACALYYFTLDSSGMNAGLLHMSPFYALVLVPFNIGYMWLNVVVKDN